MSEQYVMASLSDVRVECAQNAKAVAILATWFGSLPVLQRVFDQFHMTPRDVFSSRLCLMCPEVHEAALYARGSISCDVAGHSTGVANLLTVAVQRGMLHVVKALVSLRADVSYVDAVSACESKTSCGTGCVLPHMCCFAGAVHATIVRLRAWLL